MGLVLTSGAVIMCSHGGTVRPVPSQSKLTIDGQPVLVVADLAGATVVGCTNIDPRAGLAPCVTTISATAGQARSLTVGGQPVLLEDAQGRTSSTPPGDFSVRSAGQTKVDAA